MLLLAACAPPMPPEAMEIALSGVWRQGARAVSLPTSLPVTPEAFTRVVEVPAAWQDAHLELELPATGWRVRVTVDGAEVGSGVGGMWPVTVDLTRRLPPGRHTLGVVVEPATSENVTPGRGVDPISAWVYEMPRSGEANLRGPIVLKVGGDRRVERLDARLVDGGGTVEATAWTSGISVGDPVALSLVRDGEVHATLAALVETGGRARAVAPWTGSRWPAEEGLYWLVAEAGPGTRAQTRVGMRSAEVGEDLRVNGQRRYLAAYRVPAAESVGRHALGRALTAVTAVGANAVEVHGEFPSPLLLDSADELGLPVVLVPRCDGQRNRNGVAPEDPARDAFLHRGDERARDALRRHPSILLWATEAEIRADGQDRHRAFGEDGLPAVSERRSGMLGDPSKAPVGKDAGREFPFYVELPWGNRDGAGRTAGARLAQPLARHASSGIGMVLPALTDTPDLPEIRAEIAAVVQGAGIEPYRVEPRRGVSTLAVKVTRAGTPVEGVPVVLDIPAQVPMGGVSDSTGTAWLEAWYVGPATVRSLDGHASRPVTLSAGVWDLPEWRASIASVVLEVE